MSGINWQLLRMPNIGQNALAAFQQGMKMGDEIQQARDKREYRNALAQMVGPDGADNSAALGVIARNNPELALKFQDRARDAKFRAAQGRYLGANNALLGLPPMQPGGMTPGIGDQHNRDQANALPADIQPGEANATAGTAAPGAMPASPLGEPQDDADRAFLEMMQVARMREAFERIARLIRSFPKITDEPYDGSRDQRRQLRNFTSKLIGRFIQAAKLANPESGATIEIERYAQDEVRLLKHLARHYVIGLPALQAQQFGQRKIIRDLFQIFLDHGQHRKFGLFPPRLRYIWEDLTGDQPARLAADCVAALTENEAYQLHRRLTGYESGSVLDPIVR